jgi:hypothetical protein
MTAYRQFLVVPLAVFGLGISLLWGSVGFGLQDPQQVGPQGATQADRLMRQRVSVSIRDRPVAEAVYALRNQDHVGISFVEIASTTPVTLEFTSAELGLVLDALVKQVPAYRYEVVGEHLFLYPRGELFDGKYDVKIKKTTRLNVATKYTEWLRRFPEFATVVPPAIRGNPNAGVYAEDVSISGPGRIVDHLLQLLGDDKEAVVSIVFARSGVKILMLDEVR